MERRPRDIPSPAATKHIDPSSAADRRRFFIERALRMRTRGSGSDLARLMAQPMKKPVDMFVLDGIATMLIGAHAAAAYAPARMTQDVDIVVPAEQYAEAEARMLDAGWQKTTDLVFHGSRLGLRGGAWAKPGTEEQDLMTSDQSWLHEAFNQQPVLRSDGKRVIPRDYLILMKLDSARGIDQGDLNRVLGLMTSQEVEATVSVVARHYDDEQIVEDLRQSAEIGRWEYESAKTPVREDEGRSGEQ